MKTIQVFFSLIMILLVLSGCSMPSAEATLVSPTTPGQLITQVYSAVETSVQKTVEVLNTQTAVALPTAANTSTPIPTSTPTIELPPTATFPVPSHTPTKNVADCLFISQVPRAKTTISPNTDFDYHVKFYNNSKETWPKDELEFRFLRGTEMQKFTNEIEVSDAVEPGETIELMVDMRSPNDVGSFTAIWALMYGSRMLCASMVDININP